MKTNPTKQIVKLGIILSIYCIVAALALSVTYSVTLPKIQEQQRLSTERSMKSVYPNASSFSVVTNENNDELFCSIEVESGVLIDSLYMANDSNSSLIGFVVKASSQGYGGLIMFVYGINPDKTIEAVSIIEQTETPGLGANVYKSSFLDQFSKKNVTDSFIVKQDVTPITASTITSKALTNGIKKSVDFLLEHHQEMTDEK
ncbi:MAG: RnfABCDGE type electron transport complex subunit G [Caldisericia bacterium]|nr:RnfABCDGE type electron transport complex subunit G [Caldisericia bacterium]